MSFPENKDVRKALLDLAKLTDEDGAIPNHKPVASNRMINFLLNSEYIRSIGTTGTEGEYYEIPTEVTRKGYDALKNEFASTLIKTSRQIGHWADKILSSVVLPILVSILTVIVMKYLDFG